MIFLLDVSNGFSFLINGKSIMILSILVKIYMCLEAFRIHTGFDADPDPTFYLNADPDPYPGQTLPSQSWILT